METTRLSTKGQIVIPERVRRGIDEGTVFHVTRQEDLIILKRIEGLTDEEKEEMRELDRIWKDIDAGKGRSVTREEFFRELDSW